MFRAQASKSTRILWFGLMALTVSLPLSAFSQTSQLPLQEASMTAQQNLPETELRIAHKTYHLEVASTPEQAEVGLMYRTLLPPGQGMLFTFQQAQPVTFWMKNTKIPLDMLFVRHGKVVNIAHQAQPCLSDPCRLYPSGYVVDMVIELPGGTAKKDRIKSGMPVRLNKLALAGKNTQNSASSLSK